MSKKKVDCAKELEEIRRFGMEPPTLALFTEDLVQQEMLKPVPAFVPIRHDLVLLGKHYQRTILDADYYYYLTGTSAELQTQAVLLASRRLGRIRQKLGAKEMKKLRKEVYADYAKIQDKHCWNIFLHGNEQEQREVCGIFCNGA